MAQPIHEAARGDKDAEIRAELAKGVAVDERDPGVSCATGM